MRIRLVLLAAAVVAGGMVTAAEAGSCDVGGIRFTGPVCTAKCIVEAGDPFVLCTQ